MGTIISMNFKRLERGLSRPYSRAATSKLKGRSQNTEFLPPICTIAFPCRLHNTATTKQIPFGAFIVLVSQGYFFSASVAFVSALAEILVVVLAATPFSPGEIFLKLIICAYTSIGILSLMVNVLVSLVSWRKQLP